MLDPDAKGKYPQDLVAVFHASFHPTQGNIIDWAVKASDDLDLEHLEFSALPSGLHLVEEDVVYFTKDGQQGVCVFRRRKSSEQGHRGVRLSSLGILLAKSHRPRPWRHLNALKELTDTIYSRIEATGSGVLEPTDHDWEPARAFFEERKLRRSDLGGSGDWTGWSDELDGPYSEPVDAIPTLHLPHLLRIIGPSALTLYKHVLGRKRIMIYTLPPVEVASILCRVAGDFCFDAQSTANFSNQLCAQHKEPIQVIGMVTLNDLDRLRTESKTGRGWIACTTDALFMEKSSYYDLLIDLTTYTPTKSSRPTFYTSKPVPGPSTTAYRLSTVRFAWSDVKLWNEIDRILQLDSDTASGHTCCGPQSSPSQFPKSKAVSAWTDAWQVYEDVCMICAGLWMGSWRGNSTMSYSTANGPENWGAVHLEGDDDLSIGGTYVRNVGMGIEGRPLESPNLLGVGGSTSSKSVRRTSAMSWSSGKATVVNAVPSTSAKARQISVSTTTVPPSPAADAEDVALDRIHESNQEILQRRNSQVLTTMALLQTFHAHTLFQLSVLEDILVRQGVTPASAADSLGERVVALTPKDILAFELGPLSSLDSKYLEWIVEEYAGSQAKIVIKRGWRDLLGAVFGYW